MMFSRTINTWIDIEASPDRIWEVLEDFSKWSMWNSFIPLRHIPWKSSLGKHRWRPASTIDIRSIKHMSCI
jgi:hypothetical protein